MIIEKLKQFLNISPDIIKKGNVEEVFRFAMKGLKEDVLPVLKLTAKLPEKAFDQTVISVLKRNLIGKTATDVIDSYIRLVEKLIKNEPSILSLIGTLPESITTKSSTAKRAGILSLVADINSFVLMSNDLVIVITNNSSKDFPEKMVKEMRLDIANLNKLIMLLNNIEGEIKGLNKADDEININDDNIALESILKSKGGLSFGLSGFLNIPKIIYNIRTWQVDKELEKYELLKLKKQYLLKRLMEIEAELNNNPDDVNLKKAKDVYIKEINKVSYTIEKLSQY